MSTYDIHKFENEPIFIMTLTPEYSIARDLPQSNADAKAVLDAATEPMLGILDLTKASAFGIDDLIAACNTNARGEKPIWHHPMQRDMILVTESRLLKLATQGLRSVTFGGVSVQVFENVDEALAYYRSRIGCSDA
jgi:hypothetical protein